MTDSARATAGAPGFEMLGGDDTLTCTDDACLLPGMPDPGTTQPAAQ